MDVVKAQHQRARNRQPLEQIAQRTVSSMPIHNRRTGALALEHWSHHGERVRVSDAQQPDAALAQPAQVPIDRIAPQRVSQVALELRRARTEHHATFARRDLCQLEQQPRLADPRLPFDHQNPAGRATRRRQRSGEFLALTRTPHQGGSGPGAQAGHFPSNPDQSDRSIPASRPSAVRLNPSVSR